MIMAHRMNHFLRQTKKQILCKPVLEPQKQTKNRPLFVPTTKVFLIRLQKEPKPLHVAIPHQLNNFLRQMTPLQGHATYLSELSEKTYIDVPWPRVPRSSANFSKKQNSRRSPVVSSAFWHVAMTHVAYL